MFVNSKTLRVKEISDILKKYTEEQIETSPELYVLFEEKMDLVYSGGVNTQFIVMCEELGI